MVYLPHFRYPLASTLLQDFVECASHLGSGPKHATNDTFDDALHTSTYTFDKFLRTTLSKTLNRVTTKLNKATSNLT